jgi:DNA modification methylase
MRSSWRSVRPVLAAPPTPPVRRPVGRSPARHRQAGAGQAAHLPCSAAGPAEGSPAGPADCPPFPLLPAATRFCCGSAARLVELGEASVHLTVTSPPYLDAIEYAAHVRDPRANYRTGAGPSLSAYLALLRAALAEVYRVTAPGRIAALVIGTVLSQGRHLPLPAYVTVLAEELGWEFWEGITWNKVTGGVKRAGSSILRPQPGYYYPNIMTEQILLFRKPGERIYHGRSPLERALAAWPVDEVFKRDIANNVWHVPPVPPNTLPHPCPFPDELPYRLIRLYSYPGETVLDPFCGLGTTLRVANRLDREAVGYDNQPQYIDYARAHVAEPLRLREHQLVPRYEKVRTP